MTVPKGVRIFFEPGTRVRSYIRNQTLNVEVRSDSLYGRRVSCLTIRRGEAAFINAGGVAVKMPGSDEWWKAFTQFRVLEIHDLRGKVLERNHNLCTKCGRLDSGVDVEPVAGGKVRQTYSCMHCNNSWTKIV